MKSIHLEVEDNSYQAILNFIKLLPENCCRVLETETLSQDEKKQIQHSINQIKQNDYSEFDDWETLKEQL